MDLLYVLKPDVRFGFRSFEFENELTALFGPKVDLVGRSEVNEHLREQVLNDARVHCAA